VRLHNLGDFYSVEYVELWRKLLEQHILIRHGAIECSVAKPDYARDLKNATQNPN
jgi:hypothetical protein